MKPILYFLFSMSIACGGTTLEVFAGEPQAAAKGWCELQIQSKREFLQGEPVNIFVHVRNTSNEPKIFYKPLFKELIGNITLEVFHKKSVDSAPKKIRLIATAAEPMLAFVEENQISLTPQEEAVFEVNLRKYFSIGFRDIGDYEVRALLADDRTGPASGSAKFAITSRQEVRFRTVSAPMDSVTAALQGRHESNVPSLEHRVTLVQKAPDVVRLVYESSQEGLSSAILLYEGKNVGDFEVVYAKRKIPADSGVMYDENYVVHYNRPLVIQQGDPRYSLITYCDYVAVPYIVEGSLFFWTLGRYGPLPAEVRKDSKASPSAGPEVLSQQKKIADKVRGLNRVTVKDGRVKIVYVTDNGAEATVILDERGRTNGN